MLDIMKLLDKKCEIAFSKIPENANIIVRNGFAEDAEIISANTEKKYFLKQGVYSFEIYGDNLCAVHKVFVVKRDNLGKKLVLDVPVIPYWGRESEYGGPIFLFPDEMEEQLYSLNNLKEVDETIFDTPAFEERKEINQFTTNDEKKEYIKNILKGCEYSYLEENLFPYPVVFFAKNIPMSEMSVQEIFSALHENGKLNLFYHAQLHGIETPAGEGALTIVKKMTSELGEILLDKMNIVIVPCVNQKGNAEVRRDKDGIDLNRDFLRTSTEEIQELHKIFYELKPEVVVDAHTWTRANLFKKRDLKKALFDVRISAANSLNMDESIIQINEEMAKFAQNECRKAGFRTGYYGASVNRSHSKTYYSLSPCCSIVFECEGTRSAKYHFKRNVWAQHKGITSIFNYVYDNCEKILEKVNNLKENIRESRFIHEGRFVVKQKRSGMKKYVSYIDNYDFYGKRIKKNDKVCYYMFDIPVETIQTPKAYVIECSEMDEKWISFFEKIHGIHCEEKVIESDMHVISLEKEKNIILSKGSRIYWFPSNQLQIQVMEALFVESYREFEVKKEDGIYAYYG